MFENITENSQEKRDATKLEVIKAREKLLKSIATAVKVEAERMKNEGKDTQEIFKVLVLAVADVEDTLQSYDITTLLVEAGITDVED